MSENEKIYGRKAALAVLTHRMHDVVRIAYGPRDRKELGPHLREASQRRVPYAELDDPGLSRLAESLHHEGLVVIARRRRSMDAHELFAHASRAPRSALLALDGITNPHNVGAIVRSAAFFGLDAIAVRARAGESPLTPAATRIAEGAAELLPVVPVPDLEVFLEALGREGHRVFAADMRGGRDAFQLRWPARSALVLGAEGAGLSPEVRRVVHDVVSIPGTGAVESLNVSVAAGVLVAAWTHGGPGRFA